MINRIAQNINEATGFKVMKTLTVEEVEELYILSANKLLGEHGQIQLTKQMPEKVIPMDGAILLFMVSSVRDLLQQTITTPLFRFKGAEELDAADLKHILSFLSDAEHHLNEQTQKILGALA